MDFVHPVRALIPGVQGRVLAVLAETTAELNLRTVARLAEVSTAQASRVMPGLVELGLVERREVPPSLLFSLNRENAAAQVVVSLASLYDTVLARIGEAVGQMSVPPVSVIVFGSFARRAADRDSDIDVVIVRPDEVDGDDESWVAGVEQWRRDARSISGNAVEVIEIELASAIKKLKSGGPLWTEIARDGLVVYGAPLPTFGGGRMLVDIADKDAVWDVLDADGLH